MLMYSRYGEVQVQETDWKVVWPGNTGRAVLGRPRCGWYGEYCQKGIIGVQFHYRKVVITGSIRMQILTTLPLEKYLINQSKK